MFKLKTLEFLSGFIMYVGTFMLMVLCGLNILLHRVMGLELYAIEFGVSFLVVLVVAGFLTQKAEEHKNRLFHEYCKTKEIEPTLSNWNDWMGLQNKIL
ncbi:hypothetical protein ABD87_22860 [Lysinibacillus sphaericus]|uniref:hypothetical protein n=1 Tax=Lysinibacillus sphaericus TaxID=1421 RepID=UPI0018CCC248|nr:hypothetical protein [Lysinibacillus sphaericus]MBG9732269.1 hypothetical protein [Lysinibacillus sphaericus]